MPRETASGRPLRCETYDTKLAVSSFLVHYSSFPAMSAADAITGATYSLITLASMAVWAWVFARRRAGKPPLDFRERPALVTDGLTFLTVLGVVFIWSLIPVAVTQFFKLTDGPSLRNVQISCLISGLTFVGSMFILIGSGRFGQQELGLEPTDWKSDLRDGGLGYLAAFLPILLVLLATKNFRSEETMHPFLQVLRQHPQATTVLWMILAAVVIAPLLEELLFRVVLQGALTARIGPQLAIPLVALAFSAVHGWSDSLPLIPLALVLGYVFHQRHSYLAVVVLHAIFNATNLVFALLTAQEAGVGS